MVSNFKCNPKGRKPLPARRPFRSKRHGALTGIDRVQNLKVSPRFRWPHIWGSPLLQKPLDLGADVVMHSETKFINCHSDIVGGIVVAKTEFLHKQLRTMLVNLTVALHPCDEVLARDRMWMCQKWPKSSLAV